MPGLDPGIHRNADTVNPRIKSAGDAFPFCRGAVLTLA